MKQIRVLQIINDFKKGGVQGEVIWPARILPPERVHFDVVLLSDIVGFYEEEFKNYGNIYRISLKRKNTRIGRILSVFFNYFTVKKAMLTLLRSNEPYDAVHGHHTSLNAPCVSAAKKCGVPVRIAYCAVNKPEGKIGKDRLYFRFYLKLCSVVLNRCCTHKFGVTQNAADYIFGKGKGVPIKNPTVDFSYFDPDKLPFIPADEIRLLMVGSFSSRKNQKFAIDVLSEIKKLGHRASLTLIGYPRSEKETYLQEMREKIEKLGLLEETHFLSQDSNIPEAMSKSDFLLMPSLQEGLPNVALEAQRMGLPCVISTDVSNDCDCGLCSFLSLDNGPKSWAEFIIDRYRDAEGKREYIDMSAWDNRKVCELYMDIWSGRLKQIDM